MKTVPVLFQLLIMPCCNLHQWVLLQSHCSLLKQCNLCITAPKRSGKKKEQVIPSAIVLSNRLFAPNSTELQCLHSAFLQFSLNTKLRYEVYFQHPMWKFLRKYSNQLCMMFIINLSPGLDTFMHYYCGNIEIIQMCQILKSYELNITLYLSLSRVNVVIDYFYTTVTITPNSFYYFQTHKCMHKHTLVSTDTKIKTPSTSYSGFSESSRWVSLKEHHLNVPSEFNLV